MGCSARILLLDGYSIATKPIDIYSSLYLPLPFLPLLSSLFPSHLSFPSSLFFIPFLPPLLPPFLSLQLVAIGPMVTSARTAISQKGSVAAQEDFSQKADNVSVFSSPVLSRQFLFSVVCSNLLWVLSFD